MKKLLSLILTITTLCSMAITVFADDTVNDVVKVGINAEFKPFEYYEGDELKGFDVELMDLIGEKIGRKIEFVNMDFDALIPAVLSGRVDCAISAITVTEDRDKVIDYSREYLRTTTVTFENGQISRKYGEDYAIVFRDGVAQAKYRSIIIPTDYEKLYMNIDDALSDLSQNRTVGKLIEKYDLNQPLDETKENIEYMDVRGCGTPPSKNSATSVPVSKWAADSIETARKINIISGNYNFPGAITREEFCELVFNYIKNFPGSAFSVGIIKPPFTDTDNEHIEVLNALGIVKGKSETEFAPNDSLTREEAAAILCRLINKIYPGRDATAQYFDFADSGEISEWAMNDIQVICNMGIMQGMGDNRFAPKGLYTTEQAVATLVRVYNNFSKSNDISNAENLSYSQIEDLQESVNNGHFPWRLDYKQVIMNFLSDRGEKAENGELVAFAGDGEKCSGNYKIGNSIYTLELFKPIDKSETGIWIVKSCAKKDVIDGADGETEISVSDLTFADKLNAQMPANKNYMFSPLSVKMALALAANGAEGDTKNEILNTLGVKNLDEFNTLSKDLIKRYSQTDILNLNIANSIWINKDKTTQNFSKNFKNIATEYYNADVKTVDNKNAVGEINSWVKDKTKGKIPQIIDNADNFWAMLINAVYFKGAWENEFSTSLTKPDEFTNADGTKTQTDFMNKTSWISYAETKSAKIIELPYKNRVDKFSDSGEHIGTDSFDDLDVSMYLMLADSGINAERELDTAINGKSFERTYTKLSMPKFKIEYSERLNDTLKNIGIKTAFDTKTARFEKMFDSGNMWFTDTIHKTFISVDEKGTEAAAVTSIGMGGSALPPEPIELKFNKPFYFAIRDNTSGEILFMGRYAFAE